MRTALTVSSLAVLLFLFTMLDDNARHTAVGAVESAAQLRLVVHHKTTMIKVRILPGEVLLRR